MAVGARVRECAEQDRMVVVDRVGADVQVLVDPVERADLDAGDDADRAAARGRRGERGVDAGDGVVIGQREQLDAGVGRRLDDLRGRERTVARGRVGLEIEGRRGDLRQPTC